MIDKVIFKEEWGIYSEFCDSMLRQVDWQTKINPFSWQDSDMQLFAFNERIIVFWYRIVWKIQGLRF